MKPLIEKNKYTDPKNLRLELDLVFLRHWFFAGITSGLDTNGDFRCIEVGEISVVLQNFEGQIHAFNNVCTHRFSRLQKEQCGNRELKCPYHGWTFNKSGLPHVIPRKPLIREITPETLPQYRLSRWHLRTLGPLIFIRKEHFGETLADDDLERQFGDFFQPLSQLATACGELIENTEYIVAANWKVVVENTLEGYHVDCVHPNTIRKLGMTGLNTSTGNRSKQDEALNGGSVFSFSALNSAVFSPLDPKVSERMDRTYKFLANRPARLEGYRHFYFFPGFVFASTRGESFSIQRILPIDEKTTQLTSFLFTTHPVDSLTKMDIALRKQFYLSAAEFVRAIFAEDAAICAEVQRGVGFAHTTGVLSDEEERICAFHKAYCSTLEADVPPRLQSAFPQGADHACSP